MHYNISKMKVSILNLIKNSIIFLSLFSIQLSAEQFSLNYNDVNKYQLNFVGNFKVYINGKYKGLNVREMKGILDVNYSTTSMQINGDIYENYGKAIVTLYDREDIEILEVRAVTQYLGKKEFMRKIYDCFRISYKYGKI